MPDDIFEGAPEEFESELGLEASSAPVQMETIPDELPPATEETAAAEQPADNNMEAAADTGNAEEKPKRHRRTKAEIQAAKAAEAESADNPPEDTSEKEPEKTEPEKTEREDKFWDTPLDEVILRVGLALSCPKSNAQIDPLTGRSWNYRTVDEIMKALIPYRRQYGFFITCDSHPILLGNFNYIEATVEIRNLRGESMTSRFSAREDQTRPGQWAAQISGSCDTYAKKRALESLFMIDDGRADPDAQTCTIRTPVQVQNNAQPSAEAAPSAPAPQPAISIEKKPLNIGIGDYWLEMRNAAAWAKGKEAFKEYLLSKYKINEDAVALLTSKVPEA